MAFWTISKIIKNSLPKRIVFFMIKKAWYDLRPSDKANNLLPYTITKMCIYSLTLGFLVETGSQTAAYGIPKTVEEDTMVFLRKKINKKIEP